jgi:DNA-binding beta-propeller fold protein YncE
MATGRIDSYPIPTHKRLLNQIMKAHIVSLFSGTSHIRSLSFAVALWLGLSGVFLVEASIEKADGATDPFREFFVGGIPDGVLFDGTYIWVADFLDNTVTKLQPNDGTVLGTFPTMGVGPRYLAFDGKNIWVTHYGQGGRVSKLRASDGVFIGSYYAGEYPAELVYAAGKIWIAAGGSGGGVVLRASDGKELGGFGPFAGAGVTFDGENVWVTSSFNNNVTKVRGSDGSVLGTFDVGATPIGVAFDRGNIWVANYDDNTVTKLRASDGALLGTFASGDENPQWIAFDRAGNVWVTENGRHRAVSVLSASDGLVEEKFNHIYPTNITSDGSNIRITLDGGSSSLARFSPGADTSYRKEQFQVEAANGITFDGTNIWVAQDGPGTVTELRASDGSVVGVFPAGGSLNNGITYDGTYIWVVNYGNDTVTRLLQSDGSMQGSFPVGDLPASILFDGANIWITNLFDDTVTKLRASDGLLLGTFPVGGFPEGVAFDGENVWVTNYDDDTVTKLQASDGKLLGTFPVGNAPYGIAFDGTYIWVSNILDDTVIKLQPSDGSILDTGVVGHAPGRLAVDGTDLLVVSGGGATVEQLGLQTADYQHNYGFIRFPEAVLFDGTSIWVTDRAGVSKITPTGQ